MDMKLEVVVLPVSDVNRSKRFYEGLGWRLDADIERGPSSRVVQLTPPGSGTSIQFGKGLTSAPPGSVENVYLVVYDIEAARAELVGRGVAVSEIVHRTDPPGPGLDPERRSYASVASFKDPDGNSFLLQEIRERLPGRDGAPPKRTAPEPDGAKLFFELLMKTAQAHGVHEKETGKPDPEWPAWYAAYLNRAFHDAGYHISASP